MKAFLAWAGFLLAMTAAAKAEDFTITVPVAFHSLSPEIIATMVWCSAYTATSTAGVGSGVVRRDFSGGTYDADVVVAFNARAGLDPATATRYECGAYFFGPTVGGITTMYFSDSVSPRLTFPLAAGAPFVLRTGIQPLP